MSWLSDVFGRNMTLVFFVYGLAWFTMGLAIVFAVQRSLRLILTGSLSWLAAFGFAHGIVEWLDMFRLMPDDRVPFIAHPYFATFRLGLQALSVFFLVIFSVSLLNKLSSYGRLLRWLPVALVALWLTSPLYAPLFEVQPATPNDTPVAVQRADTSSAADSPSTISGASCVYCHRSLTGSPAQPNVPVAVSPSSLLEIASRYLLYLPGLLIGAVGFSLQGRIFRKQGLPSIANACYGVAAAFILNSLVAGLVVAPAPYIPAIWINYHTFISYVGVPPQVFRAMAAVITSVLIVRILRIYRIEQERKLELAREARQRMQEHLSKLSVQTAVAEERERIGREIHDGLAQSLAGLHILSSVARKYLAAGERARAEAVLREIEQMVDDSYRDARDAITSLRASTSSGSGLVSALQEYVSKFDEQSGLSTELVVGEDWRAGCLSAAAETQAIHIIQEALSDAHRHAAARKVVVELNVRDDHAEIIVQDDGQSIDAARQLRPDDGPYFGPDAMRQRAESVGGSLERDSTPGHGNCLILRLPLETTQRPPCDASAV